MNKSDWLVMIWAGVYFIWVVWIVFGGRHGTADD